MSKKKDESVTYCGGIKIPSFDISELEQTSKESSYNDQIIDDSNDKTTDKQDHK
ncbi:MAG: hypothetical protein IKW90_09245 [Lachnospiraceae bacterium]|nr:hypothetical protein [Lachnospiraceae bacterium]